MSVLAFIGGNYLSIEIKNSSLDIEPTIFSFKNSIASTGVISAMWFLNTHTRCRIFSSTNRSSRLVLEATISIAGQIRLLAMRRSS